MRPFLFLGIATFIFASSTTAQPVPSALAMGPSAAADTISPALATGGSTATEIVSPTLATGGSTATEIVSPTLATGELYHFELTAALWKPTLKSRVSSEQFGLNGTDIDLAADTGLTDKTFAQIKLVLRPFRKHKFRLEYLPMSYSGTSLLPRTLVFNGQRFDAGRSIETSFRWRAAQFAYEYDFIYRDRYYVGVILEAKYTSVRTELSIPGGPDEFATEQAPIPALGLAIRVYPLPNLSVTTELTGFRIPSSIDPRYQARYADVDAYATLNFNDRFGVAGGYRRLNAFYQLKHDTGHLDAGGAYFGAIVRY